MAHPAIHSFCRALDSFINVEVSLSLTFARLALQSDQTTRKRVRNHQLARQGYDTALRSLQTAQELCPHFDVNHAAGLEKLRTRLLELDRQFSGQECPSPARATQNRTTFAFQAQSRAKQIESKLLLASTFSMVARSKLAEGKATEALRALDNARLSIGAAQILMAWSTGLLSQWIDEMHARSEQIQQQASWTEQLVHQHGQKIA